MTSALDVADWMLARAAAEGVNDVTNMKLNKLVYFAQAHTLGATGQPLYEDETQAWDHGPVVQAVYNRHRGSSAPIRDVPNPPAVDPATAEILDAVWAEYGRMSSSQLRGRSHTDAPWSNAHATGQRFAVMPIESIRLWYHRAEGTGVVILSTWWDYLDEDDLAALDAADTPDAVAAAVAYLTS